MWLTFPFWHMGRLSVIWLIAIKASFRVHIYWSGYICLSTQITRNFELGFSEACRFQTKSARNERELKRGTALCVPFLIFPSFPLATSQTYPFLAEKNLWSFAQRKLSLWFLVLSVLNRRAAVLLLAWLPTCWTHRRLRIYLKAVKLNWSRCRVPDHRRLFSCYFIIQPSIFSLVFRTKKAI